MKVIAAYSHKGGTGKTTALMMLANAIADRGQSALLVDCDPQQNFAMYRANSLADGQSYWSDLMDVKYLDFEATSVLRLEEELLNADESGKYDYALLNLAGADHHFNRLALRYAELTLLPFKPAATELSELYPAIAVLEDLKTEAHVGEVRVVLTMIKSKLSASQLLYKQAAMEAFPVMDFEIPENTIFADLVMRGLLSRVIEEEHENVQGLDKVALNRVRAALNDCHTLLAEADKVIEGQGT